MTATPFRMRLSRAKGFNLQAASRALNGLEAVNVTRRSKWGNPFRVGLVACSCRSAGECPHNSFNRETAAEAVQDFRAMPISSRRVDEIRAALRGKNLACWCKAGEPCHADVLLEIANR